MLIKCFPGLIESFVSKDSKNVLSHDCRMTEILDFNLF